MKLKIVSYAVPETSSIILRAEKLADEPGYVLLSASQHGNAVVACWGEEVPGAEGQAPAAALIGIARQLARLADAAERAAPPGGE